MHFTLKPAFDELQKVCAPKKKPVVKGAPLGNMNWMGRGKSKGAQPAAGQPKTQADEINEALSSRGIRPLDAKETALHSAPAKGGPDDGIAESKWGAKMAPEMRAALPKSALIEQPNASWTVHGPSDYDKQLGVGGTLSVVSMKGKVNAGTPKKVAAALTAHFKEKKLNYHVINTIHRGMEAHIRIGEGPGSGKTEHMVKAEGFGDLFA